MIQGFDIGEEVHLLDIDSVAHFDFDQAHDVQDSKGLPQGVAADVKLLRQAPFGREAVSGGVFLPQNQRLNLVGCIFVEPNPPDGL